VASGRGSAGEDRHVDLAEIARVDEEGVAVGAPEVALVESAKRDQALHLLEAEDVRADVAAAADRARGQLALERVEELEEIRVVHRQVAERGVRDGALAGDVARERLSEAIADETGC
jgi:hypothetical protein